MKVSVYLVTYKGDENKTENFKDIPPKEKEKIGKELTDKFMKRAGFSPVPG